MNNQYSSWIYCFPSKKVEVLLFCGFYLKYLLTNYISQISEQKLVVENNPKNFTTKKHKSSQVKKENCGAWKIKTLNWTINMRNKLYILISKDFGMFLTEGHYLLSKIQFNFSEITQC